jgi:hypothetical protein
MGHCDSSTHVSGYGGVCGTDERAVEIAAEARRGDLRRDWLQGLKPRLGGGFMSQLKLRPPKDHQGTVLTAKSAGKWTLLLFVRFYQIFLSPFFGGACKFYPSCSRYGYEAIARHGAWRGSVLAAKRLLRCRPFTKGGFDPVPDVADEAEPRELQGLKPQFTVAVDVTAKAVTHKAPAVAADELNETRAGKREPTVIGAQDQQELAQ